MEGGLCMGGGRFRGGAASVEETIVPSSYCAHCRVVKVMGEKRNAFS